MHTMRARSTVVAILPLLVLGGAAGADDIRPAMEIANAQFLTAFNTPNPSAFLPLYTQDSVLFFQGAPPVTGPEAIMKFWELRIKLGVRDHTFDIIETEADGKYAFQVTKTTVQLVRDNGEKTFLAGHTVRIFESRATGRGKRRSTCSTGLAHPSPALGRARTPNGVAVWCRHRRYGRACAPDRNPS